jgi:NAD(P)H-nitrite reductase large subunit
MIISPGGIQIMPDAYKKWRRSCFMKKDLKEKGAIIQRDMQTYAIKAHAPGGFVDPAYMRRLADIAERFNIQAIKLTSAQRIMLIGLTEDKIDEVIAELGENGTAAAGLCVRYVKVCPGTRHCKRGQQDSVAMGLEMDERYHGLQVGWKFKMGVSGCANDCSEVCIKDLGLIGTPKGWKIMVGGNGGSAPRLALKLVENIPGRDEALTVVDKIVSWFKSTGRTCRIGKIIDEIGIEKFRQDIL